MYSTTEESHHTVKVNSPKQLTATLAHLSTMLGTLTTDTVGTVGTVRRLSKLLRGACDRLP